MSASSRHLLLLATFAASTAFVVTAQAQVPMSSSVPFDPQGSAVSPQPPARLPHALDLNGDALLSREEAQSRPRLAREFDAIDANRDGVLSHDELRAWHAAHPKGEHGGAHRGFARVDANGDGMI